MTDLKSVGTDVGMILDCRYRLDEVIGEGGMARVFRAEDAALSRTVAIKLMRAPTDGSPMRVQSETTLLASLSHPSLVTLFDAHISEDEPSYLVMEYVDGPTLSARLADGPLPPEEIAALAVDIAEALHVVHEKGVVHRDIKPSNVLLWNSPLPDRAFRAKLADFGIARLLDSTRVTVPGTVIGTAAYLAPEQVRGEEPSPAADIYSLGLMLIEALTGKRAFAAALGHEALIARLTVSPTIPDEVSGGWRTLLTAMTASNPARRPTALQVALAATALRRKDATVGDVLAVLEEPAIAARELELELFDPILATMAAAALPPTEAISTADREAALSGSGQVTAAGPGHVPLTVSASSAGVESASTPLDATDRTKVLEPSVESGEPEPATRRRMIGLVIAVLALILAGAIAVGAVFAANMRADASTPPALPSVGEPLGTHLDDLLESVTP